MILCCGFRRGRTASGLSGPNPEYYHPNPLPDPDIVNLTKLGLNHVCFAVDDLEAEVARLKAKGIQFRNEVIVFQNRKLVFLSGPEGITVELAA